MGNVLKKVVKNGRQHNAITGAGLEKITATRQIALFNRRPIQASRKNGRPKAYYVYTICEVIGQAKMAGSPAIECPTEPGRSAALIAIGRVASPFRFWVFREATRPSPDLGVAAKGQAAKGPEGALGL
jgi:hypothetical protein